VDEGGREGVEGRDTREEMEGGGEGTRERAERIGRRRASRGG
jgi:hypothetical protein